MTVCGGLRVPMNSVLVDRIKFLLCSCLDGSLLRTNLRTNLFSGLPVPTYRSRSQ